MNQIANVVFAYSPKNDDELELTVGDRIEVIGYEEEGWWKGRLKGRTGVFPSNFVQVIESGTVTQTSNKINSIFGSAVNTKNSISSNSLNNISTNNSNLNNNNSTSNNNLVMNNTQQHQQQQELSSSNDCNIANSNEDQPVFHSTSNNSTMHSERRPKPLRGIGYGDIFAAGAKARPLPADPPIASSAKTTAMASERLSTTSLASTLQKPIPKKPPPPAPADVTNTNGSPPEQAPALPPKPSNQYPFLQQHQRQLPQITQQQRTVIEKVQVVYAYKPSNSDELEMEVGDIIDVLDKNIEDQGWWRGELKGKIGVFPDNFVQPIEVPQQQQEVPAVRNWQNSSRLSSSATSNQSNNTSNSEGQVSQGQVPISLSESGLSGRIKSVFADRPKGFSKELESNLERHSNPGSFLSLKRNELHQQASSGLPSDVMLSPKNNVDSVTAAFSSTNSTLSSSNNHHTLTSTMTTNGSPPRQNGSTSNSTSPLNSTSPGKLNHITATRAKGPARRPPKNILNKRNQLNDSSSSNESKRELPKLKDELTSGASLISFNQATNSTTASLPQNIAYTELLSTPLSATIDQQQQHSISSQVKNKLTPPTVQTTAPTTTTTNTTPPPWMVELRKTNAEKKRDPLPVATMTILGSSVGPVEETIAQSSVPSTPVTSVTTSPMTDTAVTSKSTPSTPTILPAPIQTAAPVAPQLTGVAPPSKESGDNISTTIAASKHEGILKQISNNVTKEINELKLEVKKLQQDFRGIEELKLAVEAMKIELKACQSATESQRKYIKDLVNNLADERKKIASMQVEIDRNLK